MYIKKTRFEFPSLIREGHRFYSRLIIRPVGENTMLVATEINGIICLTMIN